MINIFALVLFSDWTVDIEVGVSTFSEVLGNETSRNVFSHNGRRHKHGILIGKYDLGIGLHVWSLDDVLVRRVGCSTYSLELDLLGRKERHGLPTSVRIVQSRDVGGESTSCQELEWSVGSSKERGGLEEWVSG